MSWSALTSFAPALMYAVLLGLLLLAALVGALALIAPVAFARLRQWGDRSVYVSRGPTADRPAITLDRFFYRHHKAYGMAVLFLSAILLSWLAFADPAARWSLLVSQEWEPFGSIMIEAGVILFWVLGLVSVVIGTIMLVRPSALKGVETWGNRWIDVGGPTSRLQREYRVVDAWLERYPRLWGGTVFCASLTAFFLLLRYSSDVPGL